MKKENVVVKQSCHSRGMLSGIFLIRSRKQAENFCLKTTWQEGDPRQKPSGMTPYFITTRGSTLIELLVVVLIIGILAAVALPQYQKAVQKAKLARLIPLVTSLYQAEKAYYLQNGKYTPDLSALDIDFSEQCATTTRETEGYYNCPDYYVGAFDGPVNAQVGLSFKTGEQKKIAYLHFFATDETKTYHKGDIVCFSRGEVARNICKTLGKGTESKHPNNWDYQYILTH